MATPRHRLIRRREELGLSRAQVAEALHYDVSAYGRLEQGKLMLRVGRRPTLARVLEWTSAQLAIALDGERVELNGHVVPEWLGHLASVEQGACEIRDFQPFTIHALLQTQDYAAAVERADVTPRTEEEIALRVDARLTRQDVLAREPDPLELRAVLDESALHRLTGSHEVMAGQLAHLVEMAERPNVELQVLPLDAGRHSAAFGAFFIFTSQGSTVPYMACVEDRAGPHYLDRAHEVEVHVALFEHLTQVALPPTDTTDLIRTVSKERYE